MSRWVSSLLERLDDTVADATEDNVIDGSEDVLNRWNGDDDSIELSYSGEDVGGNGVSGIQEDVDTTVETSSFSSDVIMPPPPTADAKKMERLIKRRTEKSVSLARSKEWKEADEVKMLFSSSYVPFPPMAEKDLAEEVWVVGKIATEGSLPDGEDGEGVGTGPVGDGQMVEEAVGEEEDVYTGASPFSPPPSLSNDGSPVPPHSSSRSLSNVRTLLSLAPISAVSASDPTSYDTSAISDERKTWQREKKNLEKGLRKLRKLVNNLTSDLRAAESELEGNRKELAGVAALIQTLEVKHKSKLDATIADHKEIVAVLNEEKRSTVETIQIEFEIENRGMKKTSEEARKMFESEIELLRAKLAESEGRRVENEQRAKEAENLAADGAGRASSVSAEADALRQQLQESRTLAEESNKRRMEADHALEDMLEARDRTRNQAQVREGELEGRIAALSAELVRARVEREKGVGGGRYGQMTDSVGFKARDLERELEAALHTLEVERELTSSLRKELAVISSERERDAAALFAAQRQNATRVAELATKVAQLESSLTKSEQERKHFLEQKLQQDKHIVEGGSVGENEQASGDNPYASSFSGERVTQLSEQVLKKQFMIDSLRSEISALKQRLRVATNRAKIAEEALTDQTSSVRNSKNDILEIDLGYAPASHTGIRKRGGGANTASIRSVMSLHGNDRKEKIGEAIDVVDAWSVETGTYLRRNPIARGLFLLYLMMLHLWTLGLLIFHSHRYEVVHGDFGHGATGVHPQTGRLVPGALSP